MHGRSALNAMADRYDSRAKVIILADRGCESFNVFAHMIRNGFKFVVRMKDINSHGILSAHDLPDTEFDSYIWTTLTRRHTKENINNPDAK